MLGIAGFLSIFSAIVTSLISLAVIFFELGAQENSIAYRENSQLNYLKDNKTIKGII